jgi:hypothetical protein
MNMHPILHLYLNPMSSPRIELIQTRGNRSTSTGPESFKLPGIPVTSATPDPSISHQTLPYPPEHTLDRRQQRQASNRRLHRLRPRLETRRPALHRWNHSQERRLPLRHVRRDFPTFPTFPYPNTPTSPPKTKPAQHDKRHPRLP